MAVLRVLFGQPLLIYLQRRFDISLLPLWQISFGARCLLKQTSAFAYLPLAYWRFMALESLSPPHSELAVCKHRLSLGAGIPCPVAKTISITNAWYKGKGRFPQSDKYAF